MLKMDQREINLSREYLNNLSTERKVIEIGHRSRHITDYVRRVAMMPEKYTACIYRYTGDHRQGCKIYGSYNYIPSREEMYQHLITLVFTDIKVSIQEDKSFLIDWTNDGEKQRLYPGHDDDYVFSSRFTIR